MIAHAPDFRKAVQKMTRALGEFNIRGIKTNITFLENVMRHPEFLAVSGARGGGGKGRCGGPEGCGGGEQRGWSKGPLGREKRGRVSWSRGEWGDGRLRKGAGW